MVLFAKKRYERMTLNMVKFFLSLFFVCSLIFPLNACDDFYPMRTEESFEFHPIQTSIKDIDAFIAEIEKYASTFENDLILGSIQLIYDQNFDYKIDFEFSKTISEEIVVRVSITYDSLNKGIEYSRCFTGHRKVYTPYEKELDFSNWKMDFEEGREVLKEKMIENDIQAFDRIGCNCYSDEWDFRVFLQRDTAYYDAIVITVEP